MKETIEKIKEKVGKINSSYLYLGETVLDTDVPNTDENLAVYNLKIQEGVLCGNTNFGFLDLEKTITDEDDWGILEDIVQDLILEPLTDEEKLEHESAFDKNPSVYCGTYGKYNEGSLHGMWIDLTTFYDYEDFIKFCKRLHCNEQDPELMFQDFEGFPEIWYTESCMDEETFDKIIAYSELSDNDKEGFELYLDYFNKNADFDEFEEAVCGYGYACEEDYAEEYAREFFDIPERLERYIDYEAIALDLFRYGEYYFIDGWVFYRR